jgi:hypothetical protein
MRDKGQVLPDVSECPAWRARLAHYDLDWLAAYVARERVGRGRWLGVVEPGGGVSVRGCGAQTPNGGTQ